MPQISIIVPVYKVEPYLHRCVDSILAQTFTDYELILVNDGSTDRSGEICDDYAAKDSRIQVIHQKNGGQSAARNVGIDWVFANSRSEWITFIDSDDLVHPQYLEILYYLVNKYNTKCSIGNSYKVFYLSDIITDDQGSEFVLSPDNAVDSGIQVFAWGKLYSIQLFRSVRFPVGKIYEDVSTTHLLLFQCDMVAITTRNLYYYFQTANSTSRSTWSPKKLDEIEAYEIRLPFFINGNYIKARKWTAYRYIVTLNDHLDQIKNNDLYGEQYYNIVRNHLRKVLRKYGKYAGINIISTPSYYYHAHPYLSKCITKIRKILKK